jgi:hypothetical protein
VNADLPSADLPGAALAGEPGLASRIGRVIGIVLVFVAAGSPIGGLVFSLLAAATHGSWGKFDPLFELSQYPGGLLLESIVFGYWFGAGATAVAGLALGIKQAFFGSTTWWMALGTGFVAGVVLMENLGGDFDFAPDYAGRRAVLILSCVAAIMLCWSLVRNWYLAPLGSKAVP